MTIMFNRGIIINILPSSKSMPCLIGMIATQREPTDPYFYGTLSIQNAIVGSRYWVAQASNTANIVASGLVETSNFNIDSIPSVENPMLLEVRIRKSSDEIKYWPYKGFAVLKSSGGIIYVSQVEDGVLN